MIVSILASGSRGDVQPPATLAKALAGRGHDVRLLAPEDFAGLAESGVTFRPLGPKGIYVLRSEEGRAIFAKRGSALSFMRSLARITRKYSSTIAPTIRDATVGSDLIVATGLTSAVGMAVSEYWKVPIVHAWFQPPIAARDFTGPSGERSPFELPKWMNRLIGVVAEQLMWWMLFRPGVQPVRDYLGLPPAGFWAALPKAVTAGEPLLLAYSQTLLPRSSEWPGNVEVTGYWHYDTPSAWTPPAALAEFLSKGPAPIYIGFGSMLIDDPKGAAEIALAALERIGARGVLSAGWGGLTSDNLPENVFAINEAPHDWLFPKMAAIVHHCGAGTTGAALRAGKPSVCTPFIADQFFWAERLCKLGVAPKAVPNASWNVSKLGAAMETALNDTAMRARAEQIGAVVRAEDGLGRAVVVIEMAGAEQRVHHHQSQAP